MLPRLWRQTLSSSSRLIPRSSRVSTSQPPSFPLSSSFRPHVRHGLYSIAAFLTWIPVLFFFQNHVAQVMRVTGPSMSPFLNTDHDSSTERDAVFVSTYQPNNALRRGTVVAFW